jgi:hypothetical protein
MKKKETKKSKKKKPITKRHLPFTVNLHSGIHNERLIRFNYS